MSPWLETVGVVVLAAVGLCLGLWCSRLRGYWWLLGYLIPVTALGLIGLARWIPRLEFIPPVSWLLAGRTEFALFPMIGTMMLGVLISRLPRKQLKVLVGILMMVVCAEPLWLFAGPAFNRRQMEHLQTRMESDGVCRQSTDYNCGPAAAVTALRHLGLPAEEGEIAILVHSVPGMGTLGDVLGAELQKRYRDQGLRCEYRYFDSISELKNAGVTIVVTKFSFLVDHYVVVFDVTDQDVTVGDPLGGRQKWSHAEFAAKWRYVGVVLRREPVKPPGR